MPVETLERPEVEPEEVLEPDGHVFRPYDDFMAKRRCDLEYACLGEEWDN